MTFVSIAVPWTALAKFRFMRIAGSIGQRVRRQPAPELITIQRRPLEQREIAMTAAVPPPSRHRRNSAPDPRQDSDGPRPIRARAAFARHNPPTAAPVHGGVLRREVAGDPAYSSRVQSRAAGADEPGMVDLLRLHTPTPPAAGHRPHAAA